MLNATQHVGDMPPRTPAAPVPRPSRASTNKNLAPRAPSACVPRMPRACPRAVCSPHGVPRTAAPRLPQVDFGAVESELAAMAVRMILEPTGSREFVA